MAVQQRRRSDAIIVNRWTARFIPLLLIGFTGWATYVVVVLVSINYLLKGMNHHGTAIAILTIYFLLFLLMSSTYARLLYIVNWDPGYVPLGQRALLKKGKHPEPNRTGGGTISTNYESTLEPTNPDCPGLENFYTKDIFACELDGKPRWCSECENWKPDRTHHCREVGRCVRKMDHFCPWVGGVVGENSFKFFIQFVAYTALYCTFVLIVMAIYIARKKSKHENLSWEWWVILGVAAFFGLFTFSMTVTSSRFAFTNLSSIEVLGHKTQVKRFAIFVPKPTFNGRDLTPAPYTQVVYPVPIAPKVVESDYSMTDVIIPAMPQQEERDSRAVRVFAVVATKQGDNPYDLGKIANWKDVMGESALDWFLPIHRSPCCRHENDESDYKLGDAINRACERDGLPHYTQAHSQDHHAEMSQLIRGPSNLAATTDPTHAATTFPR